MRKDLQIVLLIFATIVAVLLVTYYYSKNQVQTTVWIDKKGGDGPYKLRTGDRDLEEEKLKSYDDSKNIKFKAHPSDHEVIFSTAKGLQQDAKFHQSENVPEAKY